MGPFPIEDNIINDDGSIVRRKERNIEVSGFVGILPDGDQKGKNGFVLLRRGRVVEGIDNRIFPISISTSQSRSYRYIKLYGEIHFKGAEVSFDKSQILLNNEVRNRIFEAISGLLKSVEIKIKFIT